MEWILIIFLGSGYAGGLTSIEGFNTEEACIDSGKQMKKHHGFSSAISYYCISKEVDKCERR